MKSVTIQINDLFEFEGQPVPAQRPGNAVIEAMIRRQFGLLRQPLQVEIADNAVTVSFSEESPNAQDEAVRQAEAIHIVRTIRAIHPIPISCVAAQPDAGEPVMTAGAEFLDVLAQPVEIRNVVARCLLP